ncbi:HAD family phosphatase [Actinomadura sp. 6K520]|uniref:HAD family hydrolase n=1 Tax=Actinomadura sp. 6K520 TaxID=2530364 RepID=UPI001404FE62|nr:HAD family phosphatase [Actinomadura sp. 6K520]
MDWVIFDYAGVISRPPPDDAGARPAEALGVEPADFWPAYWKNRRPYDLGAVDAGEFWRDVGERLSRPVDDALVERLVDLDLGCWLDINADTMEIIEALAARDVPLALLSNAVVEMARLIDGRSWAGHFRRRLFSADLHLTKPSPEIYHRTCELLRTRPGDVLFVDDRQENVDAARAVGIESLLFTDAARLRAELEAALPGGTFTGRSAQNR